MNNGVLKIVSAIIYLFSLADFKVTDIRNSSLSNSLLDLSMNDISFERMPADVTVYLGYTFDPFGPSRRVQTETSSQNKSHFSRSNTKIQGWSENEIDTGQDVSSGLPAQRTKRGVLHLYNMVKCATGCNPIGYKGYGCFCGFLGSGHPVDGIDRCCKFHDWCYDAAGCLPFFTYIQPYYWRCYRNRAFCAVNHGEFGGSGSCAQRLCECDRILSECLSRYPCPRNRAMCYSSPWRLLQNKLMIF